MRALAVVLALAACAPVGSSVLVNVSATAPLAATQLRVTATLAGQTRGPFAVPLATPHFPPDHSFAIDIGPELSGPLAVHVDALDAGGALLASGDGSVSVAAGARFDLAIVLGGAATPDLGAGDDLAAAMPDLAAAPDLAGSCMRHVDCASGVCRANGQCALASDVAYVDNGGMSAAGCLASGVHDGNSRATAFCTLPTALDSGKSYALVAGSAVAYDALAANSATWNGRTIVGPGRGATPPATLFASAPPNALSFNINMLTFDGMDFSGQIDCVNAGTLLLRDVSIHDSIQDGIAVGGCAVSVVGATIERTTLSGVRTNTSSASLALVDVTLRQTGVGPGSGVESLPAAILHAGGGSLVVDRSYLGPGNGVGLLVMGGSYSFTNSFIVDNVGAFAFIPSGGSGVFQFNTVANNHRGVNCSTATVIEASIFYNNNSFGSEFNSSLNCTLLNGTVTSASAALPIFLGATDYRLDPSKSINDTCCIDIVRGLADGGAPQLPDHDYFAGGRPKGAGWDVGAHEAR